MIVKCLLLLLTTNNMFLQSCYIVGEWSETGFYIFAFAMTSLKTNNFFAFAHLSHLLDHGMNSLPQRQFHDKVSNALDPACLAEQEEYNRMEIYNVLLVLMSWMCFQLCFADCWQFCLLHASSSHHFHLLFSHTLWRSFCDWLLG